MDLGTIKSSEIRKNRDSSQDSRLASCEITSPEDVQTVELAPNTGEDCAPEDGDVVVVIPITEAYKMGILVDDNISPDETLEPGEKEIYSKASGLKLAKIKLNKDGEIILNNGSDFAVAFNELKAQVDTLRNQLNTHTHAGVTPGGSSSGAPVVPFTVNVDNTKVEKVKL